MKRLAVVLALVAMSACQKAEQQQTQTPADTSKMMMSDTSKMMMVDTSMHVMKADTSKRMIAPNKPAPKKKKP
jgi:nitrous oxide reductase accessory protein NosL